MSSLRSAAKTLLAILFAAVVAFPLGFLATVLLLPLWSWIEATYGIESVGHSGPASWCYAVTTLVILIPLATLLIVISRAAPKQRGEQ